MSTPRGDRGSPGPELHLRHMTVDEALYELERYLDQAFLARLSTVRIVHGKGTGTLRKVVREVLSTHSLVNSYREAYGGEGGAGVTVVEMAEMGETPPELRTTPEPRGAVHPGNTREPPPPRASPKRKRGAQAAEMPDLFETQRRKALRQDAPLAARMRPRTFDEFVGQEHIVGPGRVLRQSIEADQIPSLILWGPPGSGKTTLAYLIASVTRSHFDSVSAVTAGVADLRTIIEQARERLGMHGQRTILFVDEIHRFNKAQQDVVLPHVEEGTVVFIGATTENPSFEVIAPLLSRCRVFALKALTEEGVKAIVRRALGDQERGVGSLHLDMAEDALQHLVAMAGGDARVALNALELAALATGPDSSGVRRVTLSTMEDALQQRSLQYDKAGDQHYDTISAFIKSVRGSDPDAAVYWLVRMIEAGEDPLFIARRLVILAAEDIGMADPQGLPLAVAAQQAVHFVGMPEGAIPLAEATVYLATAPKSNSAYAALNKAREDVQRTGNAPVPMHLRNPVTRLMKEMGYGRDYRYAHDYPGHFAPMENLPQALKGRRYYQPGDQGYERTVSQRLREWWANRKGEREEGGG